MKPAPTIEDHLARFWAKVDKSGDCWIWTASRDRAGYGKFSVRHQTHEKAHRWIYKTLVGPIAPGLVVCHSCDNPPCVNPAHLFLGTHKDNMQDAVQKGRQARGDRTGSRLYPERRARGDTHGMRKHPEARLYGARNPRARLTDEQVRAIRKAFADGAVQRHLAFEYGVSPATINRVVHGESWTHLE